MSVVITFDDTSITLNDALIHFKDNLSIVIEPVNFGSADTDYSHDQIDLRRWTKKAKIINAKVAKRHAD